MFRCLTDEELRDRMDLPKRESLGLAPFWVVRIIIHGMFIIVEEATPDTNLPPLLGNSMEPIQRPAVRAMLRDHLDYDRLELAMRPAPRNRDVEVVILFPLQTTVDGLAARIGAWAIRETDDECLYLNERALADRGTGRHREVLQLCALRRSEVNLLALRQQ